MGGEKEKAKGQTHNSQWSAETTIRVPGHEGFTVPRPHLEFQLPHLTAE